RSGCRPCFLTPAAPPHTMPRSIFRAATRPPPHFATPSCALEDRPMPEPLKMVYEKDAPLDALQGKTVAIIGFGSQGHAHAQNLRDSGVRVIVANRKDSPNGRLAIEKGFDPMSVDDAVRQADLV